MVDVDDYPAKYMVRWFSSVGKGLFFFRLAGRFRLRQHTSTNAGDEESDTKQDKVKVYLEAICS